jgi:autonomous glycyl radical cofactor GrcA
MKQLVIALAAAAALLTVPSALGSGTFTNFGLSQTPGVACPGSTQCQNPAAEPAIRADLAGNFYASSENSLGEGTEAWRSTDGGRHYTALESPNDVSSANTTGFAPGGGDTDLAVATERNAQGNYNVYVSSLTLADVDVSTSTDKGATWRLNPIGADVGGADDREWIAAVGAQKVCVSYHDAEQNIDVNCSYDAGTTFPQLASAIDPAHAFQIGENEIGNLAIDPTTGDVFQSYSAITNAAETTCVGQLGVTTGTCSLHGVYMAVSTDGGMTFKDVPVYVNPDPAVEYGHQFVNVSVDKAGNVYAVYTDDHHVYYSFSTDHGQTWSGPYLISGTSGTQIMPWSSAVGAGKLDVVYYNTSYYDGVNTPDNYPMKAAWYVGFAQNVKALTPKSAWSRQNVSPVVHYGGVCEAGVTCTGNRDLFDDFGVAASPTTGLASIVYSDDQWSSNGQTSPFCASQADTNSSNCDHTAIATQTSGTRIN